MYHVLSFFQIQLVSNGQQTISKCTQNIFGETFPCKMPGRELQVEKTLLSYTFNIWLNFTPVWFCHFQLCSFSNVFTKICFLLNTSYFYIQIFTLASSESLFNWSVVAWTFACWCQNNIQHNYLTVHIFSTECEAEYWHWSVSLKQNGS